LNHSLRSSTNEMSAIGALNRPRANSAKLSTAVPATCRRSGSVGALLVARFN
jgi:hypothetical protein